MPQDAFTLRHLTAELDKIFAGGTINRITVPDGDTVIFTVYNGKGTEKLLISANPSSPRIAVFSGEEISPLTAPNFCMLLRKHLIGAKIVKIELSGFDRIVKITCFYKGEFSDGEEKTIYAELMGRYSNVILTANGKVLGSNRGVNFFDNGIRPLITGKDYIFPPTQNKFLPNDRNLIEKFKNIGANVPEFIFNNVTGLALSTAEEIARSFALKIGAGSEEVSLIVQKDPESFFDFLNEFIYSERIKPCIEEENGEYKDVFAFPYATVSGNIKYFDNLYLAENEFYDKKQALKRFKEKKDGLLHSAESAKKKIKKRLSTLYARKADADSAEENRLKGELIISNIYKLKYGDEKLVAENYYDGGKEITIPLDKSLSPADNAERYFKKYNKQKRTLFALEPFIKQAESEYEYLQSLVDFISIAESEDDLIALYSEAEKYGLIKPQNIRKKKEQNKPFRQFELFGYEVKVGRSNIENDELVYSAADSDIWLHSKSYRSAHVIIKAGGKEVPEKVLISAAEICAYYSKCRDGKSEIVYTKRINLKKPKGAKFGLWNYSDYNSITVESSPHEEDRRSPDR